MYRSICVGVYVYIYVYIYKYICIWIYIYVCIYTHTLQYRRGTPMDLFELRQLLLAAGVARAGPVLLRL